LSYFSLGWTLVLWADTLMAKGEPADLEQAQGHLLGAQAIFEQMGSRRILTVVKEKIQKSSEQTYALAAAQKMVSVELAQAGLVQESFLPEQPPSLPGWQITAMLNPVRATTGDFYDFIPLPGDKFGVVIADVTDKGMGAALFMTSTRTLLRAYASEHPDHPDKVLTAVNRQITQNTHGGLYVTLFYGILDPEKKILFYCNAGHNPPYLFRKDGNIDELRATGIPLGVFETSAWEVDQVQCDPGSALILYTDGVTESQDKQGNNFGGRGVIRSVQTAVSTPGWSAQNIQNAILGSVAEFSQGLPQLDDITLVVMACKE
jgi:phosphoserine phosphatase RsbU/P